MSEATKLFVGYGSETRVVYKKPQMTMGNFRANVAVQFGLTSTAAGVMYFTYADGDHRITMTTQVELDDFVLHGMTDTTILYVKIPTDYSYDIPNIYCS